MVNTNWLFIDGKLVNTNVVAAKFCHKFKLRFAFFQMHIHSSSNQHFDSRSLFASHNAFHFHNFVP